MSKPIVIIGAGLAGLSAAVRLAERGHKVTILEATKAGGGRTRSFKHSSGVELDNGQHLLMGCYRETLAFFRAIDSEDPVTFQRNLEVHMARPGGGRVELRCPALPAPLHLGAGLLGMKGLGMLHKASAMRAGLMLRGEIQRPDDNETCDAWLRRMGQTRGIRGAFWDPFIWSVLNDDPLVASAAMLVVVLERAFMGTRDGSRLGVPNKPLSRIYVDQAIAKIEALGSRIQFASPVRELEVREGRICGVLLKNGERVEADTVISAVPPKALLSMLPEPVLRDPVFVDAAALETSPIVNLWVFADRPLFDDQPFLGLIQSPLHWLFDRNRIEKLDMKERLINVTISGAHGFVDDSADNLIELFRGEMNRYFPDRPFEILGHKVVKEKRATISHAAGSYHRRPKTRSPVPGLFLAGDWVRTGLPATIESACQSGHDAAAAIEDKEPTREPRPGGR